MNDPESLLMLDRLARQFGDGLDPRLRAALRRAAADSETGEDPRPSAVVIPFPSQPKTARHD